MKKYTVSEAKLINPIGEMYSCYFILEDQLPIYEINKWLEYKSRKSKNTSRQYAYNLCRFLNYLDGLEKEYRSATQKDVMNFLDNCLFQDERKILKIESKLTYSSIVAYFTTIRDFYKYLEDELSPEIITQNNKRKTRSAKYHYLYGQIWDVDTEQVLKVKLNRIKNNTKHIKWYTDEQIQVILSNLKTWRDKSIFLLTLEGFRIDEVISLKFENYDDVNGIITTNRSKSKTPRSIPLKEETRKVLDTYLFSERSESESTSGEITDYLFINLKEGSNQGKVVSYRNVINVIKGAAKRGGLNPKEIRTHSGRSTRVMEYLRDRAKHPEKGVTDELINMYMGWKSPKSIAPYVNVQDEEIMIETIRKINRRISDDKRG